MVFQSLEQRMAHAHLEMLPPFVPAEDGPPAGEQEIFYNTIRGLYRLAFDEPELFVPALHADDAHPNRFNKSSYGKPDLIKNMRRFQKEMDALLQAMFDMGADKEGVKLSKRHKAVLARLGALEGPLPAAWVWMATRPGASVFSFAHCLFQEGYPYAGKVYAKLLGDAAAFEKLEGWMMGRGYARFDNLSAIAHGTALSVKYANLAWDKKPPSGGFEYGIRHTGVSALYDAEAQSPPVLGLCIPGGLKDCLRAFDRMDEGLRRFVAARTKKCDGCRYCVQTDKTGTRPLAYVEVAFEGKTLRLCPYFPGCRYCWTRLDEPLADNLIAMLDFLDGLRPDSSK